MNAQKVTQEYRMNEWINLIKECHDSGQNVVAWCKENNIRPNRYYYWLRKIRTAACEALTPTTNQEQIVPLELSKLTDSAPTNRAYTSRAYTSSETFQADIVIHFGSAVLEIRNSASISLIENTLRILQDAR